MNHITEQASAHYRNAASNHHHNVPRSIQGKWPKNDEHLRGFRWRDETDTVWENRSVRVSDMTYHAWFSVSGSSRVVRFRTLPGMSFVREN